MTSSWYARDRLVPKLHSFLECAGNRPGSSFCGVGSPFKGTRYPPTDRHAVIIVENKRKEMRPLYVAKAAVPCSGPAARYLRRKEYARSLQD